MARLEAAHFFGEQALFANIPIRRNANARALTDVTVLVISHEIFQKCLIASAPLRKLLKEQGQARIIDKLSKLTEDENVEQKELLALFNRIKSFEERRIFFRQGDQPLYVYYVLNGLIEIRFYDNKKQIISKSLVIPGQFFGELGVLKQQLRLGTAVALTDGQVAIIEPSLIQNIYEHNDKLKKLVDASMHLYQIPMIGVMTQYTQLFFGQPAINTDIQLQNGESIVASRVIQSDLFAIFYRNLKNPQKERYQDPENPENHIREIFLDENRLVGAISVGKWDDLDQLVSLIYNKQTISEENLEQFRHSGKFSISSLLLAAGEEMLCSCMQIKTEVIQSLILEGMNKLEEICSRTGAGTVCGGCRPRIRELLGEDIWTFVKIEKIREHNKDVRSYRLRPLTGSITVPVSGQHIIIGANIDGLWVSRSYTLTSSDADKECYEITVKREEQGLFSRWLFSHDKEPISLRVSTPEGTFLYPFENESPIIFFVAGIGITPAIAFAKRLIKSQDRRSMHIDYSVRHQEISTFDDELSAWPTQFSNFSISTRLTSKDGHIDEKHVQNVLTKYPNAEIFICGPKGFEEMIVHTLSQLGLPSDKTHLERFIHAGKPGLK